MLTVLLVTQLAAVSVVSVENSQLSVPEKKQLQAIFEKHANKLTRCLSLDLSRVQRQTERFTLKLSESRGLHSEEGESHSSLGSPFYSDCVESLLDVPEFKAIMKGKAGTQVLKVTFKAALEPSEIAARKEAQLAAALNICRNVDRRLKGTVPRPGEVTAEQFALPWEAFLDLWRAAGEVEVEKDPTSLSVRLVKNSKVPADFAVMLSPLSYLGPQQRATSLLLEVLLIARGTGAPRELDPKACVTTSALYEVLMAERDAKGL